MTETTNQSNGLAIGGLVVGIISLFLALLAMVFSTVIFYMPYVVILFGLLGLTLSILGLRKSELLNNRGRGASRGGMVMSILALFVGGISLWFAFMANQSLRDVQEDLQELQELQELQDMNFEELMKNIE